MLGVLFACCAEEVAKNCWKVVENYWKVAMGKLWDLGPNIPKEPASAGDNFVCSHCSTACCAVAFFVAGHECNGPELA